MERSISIGPVQPRKVDRFFRNFSGWTEPIHSVLDRNFRKFWLNGSRPACEKKTLCSLQTKRAIYLTKTPFQLHDILSYTIFECLYTWNLTPAIVQWSECFHVKNRLEKLSVFVFRREGKILLTLFDEQIFPLVTLSTPCL